mgnify:CR=1 FL=1
MDRSAAFWGPWFGLGLFSVETLLALIACTLYPLGQAREPICQECSSWLCEEPLGHAAHGETRSLIEALYTDSATALESLREPDTREYLEFNLASCQRGHDDDAGVLRLREHFFAKRSRTLLVRHRADVLLDSAETRALRERLAAWSSARQTPRSGHDETLAPCDECAIK